MNLTGSALQLENQQQKDYIHREMKIMIQSILINIKLTVSKIIIFVRWFCLIKWHMRRSPALDNFPW